MLESILPGVPRISMWALQVFLVARIAPLAPLDDRVGRAEELLRKRRAGRSRPRASR